MRFRAIVLRATHGFGTKKGKEKASFIILTNLTEAYKGQLALINKPNALGCFE